MSIRRYAATAARKLPSPAQRLIFAGLEEWREAKRAKAVRKLAGEIPLESPPCALCGGRRVAPHMKFNGFRIVRCREDGLMFTSPRPVDVSPFYSETYYRGEPAIGYGDYEAHASTYRENWRSRLVTLHGDAQTPKGLRLLDVGCATGEFLRVARDAGWTVAGVELSDWAARTAAQEHNLDVIQGSLPDERIPGASYDAVTLFDSIEHLSDPAAVLRDVRRILKPSGLLMLSTGALPHEDPARVSKWYYPPWHLYYFSEETIRALVERCGFELVSYEEQDRDIPAYTLMLVVARSSAQHEQGRS